jgi:DNA-directed RNA polymerase beta' subunit
MEESTGEYEIDHIQFGMLSTDDIIKMSTVHVTNSKITSSKSMETGSVYDARMGTCAMTQAQRMHRCVTCNLQLKDCHGHFGYVMLNTPVTNPLCMKHILNYLKMFCFSCYRLVVREDQLQMYGLLEFSGVQRYLRILQKIKTSDICNRCSAQQPKYSLVIQEQVIYAAPRTSGCVVSSPVALSSDTIFRVFDNILDEDVVLIGIQPQHAHPRNFILQVLPILPTMSRPFAVSGGQTLLDDDLTVQYIEILKINAQLTPAARFKHSDQRLAKVSQLLHMRIQDLFRNSKTRSKHGSKNGHVSRGYIDRITGKQGQIRNNIMGKRVDKTGRSVIGAEPTMSMQEFGVPKCIATTLTFPEVANRYNLAWLQGLVDGGKTNFLKKTATSTVLLTRDSRTQATALHYGDVLVRPHLQLQRTPRQSLDGFIYCGRINNNGPQEEERSRVLDRVSIETRHAVEAWMSQAPCTSASFLWVLDPRKTLLAEGDVVFRGGARLDHVEPAKTRSVTVEIGDVVERHLHDGDVIVINRQPTLHRGSMMGRFVRVMPGNTFRMDLASTGSFNADFDGDEFNIHVPQDQESRVEIIELSMTSTCIISAATSTPNINIVQDSMLGAYILSRFNEPVGRAAFFDICMVIRGVTSSWITERIAVIEAVMGKFGEQQTAFTGRGVLSLVFPPNFSFSRGDVCISSGVFVRGELTKLVLNKQIISCIHENYSIAETVNFIDNLQFVIGKWFEDRSFSIGLQDCVMTGDRTRITAEVQKCLFEADHTQRVTHVAREKKVCGILSNALNVGLRIAQENMPPGNNFLHTVRSGSKGAMFNLTQITGLLGQQIVMGGRPKKVLNHGARTMPHFPFCFTPEDVNEEFKSQGFIDTGFGEGLDPRQLFFHAITGREGVTDSALETANSGYAQRRLSKIFEDVVVAADGTVRDQNNTILSLVYGDHGLDPLIVRNVRIGQKTTQRFCDAAFLLDITHKEMIQERLRGRTRSLNPHHPAPVHQSHFVVADRRGTKRRFDG